MCEKNLFLPRQWSKTSRSCVANSLKFEDLVEWLQQVSKKLKWLFSQVKNRYLPSCVFHSCFVQPHDTCSIQHIHRESICKRDSFVCGSSKIGSTLLAQLIQSQRMRRRPPRSARVVQGSSSSFQPHLRPTVAWTFSPPTIYYLYIQIPRRCGVVTNDVSCTHTQRESSSIQISFRHFGGQ